jgi:6-pyruvoyltetrahydropterin/6-carboxytetrahydropterin synthase
MITCTRRIQFCAGHRVVGHEGKCRNLHGHNYVALITAIAPELDAVGRVIDFSVLKERIGGWIDENWDHGFIWWEKDWQVAALYSTEDPDPELPDDDYAHGWLKEMKSYALPTNPTVENMANHLLRDICPNLMKDTGIQVYKIVLWETENCYATAEL